MLLPLPIHIGLDRYLLPIAPEIIRIMRMRVVLVEETIPFIPALLVRLTRRSRLAQPPLAGHSRHVPFRLEYLRDGHVVRLERDATRLVLIEDSTRESRVATHAR